MQPPSRRTLLALGLLTSLTALTACTGTDDPSSPAATPDPDAPVRRRAVAATDAVLAAYDTALAAPGQQAALLQQLRAETIRHRAALAEGLPAAASPTATTASASPTAAPPGTPAGTPAAEERRAAQAHLADLAAATGPLARLLASVAASRLLHAAALGDTAPAASTPVATPAPSTTPAAPAGTAGLAALQSALGAEHAAVYGYGIVGARLPEDQQRADARTALAAHEARRDSWQRLLTTLGSAPTPAAGGYRLPFPVQDAATAAQLAAHLETGLTGVYADLVGALPAAHRPAAAAALHEAAVRARRWGAPATPFPGIPDAAPTTSPASPAASSAAAATP
ncbi:ferritin-like domain-containing protein [Streptomyces sp. NRRL WC-3742]|uniref:ferritin-like domain-containing protein n=1 Tax=Streptomyces sp. NRRL WC-3742 TaxID=1463934 RepID=UPI000AB61FF3|nr:ferritin-like domain-containing protein [Streptomyces sp. NRRL WC-3742]